MVNLRKAVAVVMGFVACVACFGLAACGSESSSTAASSASGASSTEIAQANNTQAERLDAPADAESVAMELVGQQSTGDFNNARVTSFANKTADGKTLCQVYLFSADGKHDAYVAFDYETKEVHGMDVDQTNVIPYDTTLMSVL